MEDWLNIALIVGGSVGLLITAIVIFCWRCKKCRPCAKDDIESRAADYVIPSFARCNAGAVTDANAARQVDLGFTRTNQQEDSIRLEQQRLKCERLEMVRLANERVEQEKLIPKSLTQEKLVWHGLLEQRCQYTGTFQEKAKQERTVWRSTSQKRFQNKAAGQLNLNQERLEKQTFFPRRCQKKAAFQPTAQRLKFEEYSEHDNKEEADGKVDEDANYETDEEIDEKENNQEDNEEDEVEDENIVYANRRGRSSQRRRGRCRSRSESGDYSRQRYATNPDKTIDLHYLFVGDAMNRFVNFLNTVEKDYHRSHYRRINRFVYVITGRGLHSKDGIPKIKPAVQRYLDKHEYMHTWENNGGLATIDLLSKRRCEV